MPPKVIKVLQDPDGTADACFAGGDETGSKRSRQAAAMQGEAADLFPSLQCALHTAC
jgi:hypothetical protein